MTREMDKQNRRASRILRNFGRYVDEAAELSKAKETIRKQRMQIEVLSARLDNERAVVDQFRAARDRHADATEQAMRETPTIARTKPRTYARIKRNVAWRLMAKGRK